MSTSNLLLPQWSIGSTHICLLCSIHTALDASLGMSYILEMTGLHHFVFVFLQFIVAPSCRALCASVFFSSSECTYMHHLLLLTPLAYSVGLPFLLCVRHSRSSKSTDVRLPGFGLLQLLLVESSEPVLPPHISFTAPTHKQDYPMPFFIMLFYHPGTHWRPL